MRAPTSGTCVLLGALLCALLVISGFMPARATTRPLPVSTARPLVTTTGQSKATTSWFLYGGPGSLEGTFEDAAGDPDLGGWTTADLSPGGLVGDFSKVSSGLNDLDPCADNSTPQLHFIDDGTPPNNHAASTGGCISANWTYAGFVVNFKGGLNTGGGQLHNEAYSPEILWDDPSTTADDAIEGGALLRYDVWDHLPRANGVFHTWSVRSFPDPASGGWTEWRNRDFVYYSEETVYRTREVDVSDLLVTSPQKVQIALGVEQLDDEFNLPGGDATPAPWFDNVAFLKYDVSGPVISVREMDLFHDSFAHSGAAADTTNLADQAVRLDMGQDINEFGTQIVAGDSIVVTAAATLPGTQLVAPPKMTWFLRGNPFFDSVRQVPLTATLVQPNLWRGTVVADSARINGVVARNQWSFDLPDGPPRNPTLIAEPIEPPMFFPGDALFVFFEAEDDMGNISFLTTPPDSATIPVSETCGGGTLPKKPKPSGGGGDPIPSGGLPPLWDDGEGKAALISPRILIWNDSGDFDELNALALALSQIGVLQGRDYDVYSTQEPAAGVSNGLGATAGHGATSTQLEGYDTIFYLGGNATAPLISDGRNLDGNDKGDDIGLLDAWRLQPADRFMVYFADNTASAMVSQGALAAAYLTGTQGVSFVAADVRSALGGLTAPSVAPNPGTGVFSSDFVVFGGCAPLRQFDHIVPGPLGSITSHQFLTAGGTPIAGASAGIWWDRSVSILGDSYRRVDATFPFALSQVQDPREPTTSTDGTTARGRLLRELLLELGHSVNAGDATEAQLPQRQLTVGEVFPNPFNPNMTVMLTAAATQHVEVRVFDARGRFVASLQEGPMKAGMHAVTWDGRDAAGVPASSGVYVIEVRGVEGAQTRKALLLK